MPCSNDQSWKARNGLGRRGCAPALMQRCIDVVSAVKEPAPGGARTGLGCPPADDNSEPAVNTCATLTSVNGNDHVLFLPLPASGAVLSRGTNDQRELSWMV